jgi:hypothetical protein
MIEGLDDRRQNMLLRTLRSALVQTTAERGRLLQRARHMAGHAGIALVLLLGATFTEFPRAAFAHGYEPPPAEFSAVACYGLVDAAGRSIAWARWEKHLSLEKTRSAPFRANTPLWAIELVNGWIEDAYQWRATDTQIRQWASELGSVDDLPSADALSVHETIAIWMRRIARQCNEQDIRAAAVSVEQSLAAHRRTLQPLSQLHKERYP